MRKKLYLRALAWEETQVRTWLNSFWSFIFLCCCFYLFSRAVCLSISRCSSLEFGLITLALSCSVSCSGASAYFVQVVCCSLSHCSWLVLYYFFFSVSLPPMFTFTQSHFSKTWINNDFFPWNSFSTNVVALHKRSQIAEKWCFQRQLNKSDFPPKMRVANPLIARVMPSCCAYDCNGTLHSSMRAITVCSRV